MTRSAQGAPGGLTLRFCAITGAIRSLAGLPSAFSQERASPPAACRSSRCSPTVRKTGPPPRSPMAQSITCGAWRERDGDNPVQSADQPPWGTLCQEPWWTGPVTCSGRRAGVGLLWWLSSQLLASCRRAGRESSWRASSGSPVRAQARTNELGAGERRPMIGSRKSLPIMGCRGRDLLGSPGGCVDQRNGSHIYPFGLLPADPSRRIGAEMCPLPMRIVLL